MLNSSTKSYLFLLSYLLNCGNCFRFFVVKSTLCFTFHIQVLWWYCLCVEEDVFRCQSSSSFYNDSTNFTMESHWTSPAFWGINSSGKWDYWHIWAIWGATLCNCHYSSVCCIFLSIITWISWFFVFPSDLCLNFVVVIELPNRRWSWGLLRKSC